MLTSLFALFYVTGEFHRFLHRGRIQISDLFGEHENHFLPFPSLRNKYLLACNFLQYHGLVSAIPESWKKLLHANRPFSLVHFVFPYVCMYSFQ